MIRRTRTGFTLIEILIVVVILGILAAVVIPQFTNAADDASVASARTQLQTMRSQIELYRAQQNAYPAEVAGVGGGNPTVNWQELIDSDYMRSSPTWPSVFSEDYDGATGELKLELSAAFGNVTVAEVAAW